MTSTGIAKERIFGMQLLANVHIQKQSFFFFAGNNHDILQMNTVTN